MRVLILSSKFPYPLKDGGAIATFQIFKGLSKLADDVHLLSFNTSKHYVAEQDIPKSYFSEDTYSLVNINTKPSYFQAIFNLIFSRKPYILSRFKKKEFVIKLNQLLKTKKFDVVQVEGLYMLQYMNEIRKNSDAKIAFRAHNLEHQIWDQLAKKTKNIFRRRYLKLLAMRILNYELFCLNKYDMLLPISSEDAAFYEQLGNEKVLKIVPTGFDFEGVNKPLSASNLNKLFYIGSLEWQPNQEGILWFLENCWPKLVEKQPNIELHIAGRKAPRWLQHKFQVSGIKWHGEVKSSTDFMMDKSVMIVPLLSGSGMRIKIIEAFVNSKAVVATSVAANGTSSTDGENILIADNPEAFVDKVLKLIENRELYNKLIEKAFGYTKQNFDNHLIIKELFEFYAKKKPNYNRC